MVGVPFVPNLYIVYLLSCFACRLTRREFVCAVVLQKLATPEEAQTGTTRQHDEKRPAKAFERRGFVLNFLQPGSFAVRNALPWRARPGPKEIVLVMPAQAFLGCHSHHSANAVVTAPDFGAW